MPKYQAVLSCTESYRIDVEVVAESGEEALELINEGQYEQICDPYKHDNMEVLDVNDVQVVEPDAAASV